MIEKRPGRPKPWLARVRSPDGRRISQAFTRRVDAEAWVATQTTDIRRGEWIDPHAGDITLAAWIDQVAAGKINISPGWADTRAGLIRRHVDPYIGLYPLNQVTPEAIQAWVTDRSRVLSPETVRKLHAIVGEGLRLAVARRRIVRSPLVDIELPKAEIPQHRYLTDREVMALADAISLRRISPGSHGNERDVEDRRYRPFVLLGGYGGLRPGESFGLEWRDVDWDRQRVQVRGTKTRTSRRIVRLPRFVMAELRQHRTDYPHISYVLHNEAGQRVDARQFAGRQFARAVARSVGEPMRPYDLRHTHVALLIAEGAHPKSIADRLGHTSIRTTMDTYGHLLDGVEADVVDRLDHQTTTSDENDDVVDGG